jgi:hypothetical protein
MSYKVLAKTNVLFLKLLSQLQFENVHLIAMFTVKSLLYSVPKVTSDMMLLSIVNKYTPLSIFGCLDNMEELN